MVWIIDAASNWVKCKKYNQRLTFWRMSTTIHIMAVFITTMTFWKAFKSIVWKRAFSSQFLPWYPWWQAVRQITPYLKYTLWTVLRWLSIIYTVLYQTFEQKYYAHYCSIKVFHVMLRYNYGNDSLLTKCSKCVIWLLNIFISGTQKHQGELLQRT